MDQSDHAHAVTKVAASWELEGWMMGAGGVVWTEMGGDEEAAEGTSEV